MMYDAIVFLPLIGFLYAALFGRSQDPRRSEIVTTTLLGICAILSWFAFFGFAFSSSKEAVIVDVANWMTAGKLSVHWSLRIDALTTVMFVVVTTVSFLVHLYSVGYMNEDDSRPRFFAYLSLFTFAMLMLVTADNLVQMFFGWEGVGLASYLLIGFWYTRPAANKAAMKAFVVNRVGDFGFSLGIFLTFQITGSVSLDAIRAAAPSLVGQNVHVFGLDVDVLTITCLLLFMGAMGKSAQFLLHTWLPDAMEGPTPVSALIHAATMVTAGVFMVARLSFLFDLAPVADNFVLIVGATTAMFAATVGLVQYDIKRVIAYSTCSQLGYMFVAEGVGAYGAGIFHLFTHAFFKALLFLGAGSVIHAMRHEQDMRRMGGLKNDIPFTFWMMVIGTLALTGVGLPFTSLGFAGFVSKDAIIEAAYASHRPAAVYAFFCVTAAAALTSFYSWRLAFMTFFGKRGDFQHWLPADPNHEAHADEHHGAGHDDLPTHESPAVMLIPLAVLAFGATFAGVFYRHWFIGSGFEGFWKESIFLAKDNTILEDMEHVPWLVSLLPFLMMVGGLFVAWRMYVVDKTIPDRLAGANPLLYRFLLNKWYFDELYDFLFVRPAFWIGRLFWKGGDGMIIDGVGPDGIAARVFDVSRNVVKLQTGYVYHYAFAMLIGVSAIATWYLFAGVR
jgi:NADH-quinone oxidoreductase subunit L